MIDEPMEKIQSAAAFINSRMTTPCKTAVVTGTGLGKLANNIIAKIVIPFSEIPHFPKTTVESHSGNFIFGKHDVHDVILLQGRFHYYEGYEMEEVTFAIRVLKLLGVKNLILTNAAGSINPEIKPGSFMMLKDHINFLPVNPLRGKNIDTLGVRFPDMTNVYDKDCRNAVLKFCQNEEISCHYGVYLALQGPSLETPAELNFFNKIGADAVGMSTVPEAIVARHMSMKVAAVSVITNQGYPNPERKEAAIEDVLEVAESASENLFKIVTHLIQVIS